MGRYSVYRLHVGRGGDRTGGEQMNEKLKPCPFCGGKAHLDKDRWGYYQEIYYKVECANLLNCGAETQRYRAKSDAIKVWNRRADDVHNKKSRSERQS